MVKSSFNSNSWITTLGVVSSILAISQSAVYLIVGSDKTWGSLLIISAIIFCVIALSVLLTNSQVKNRDLSNEVKAIERENLTFRENNDHCKRIISKLSKYNHSINHQLRQTLDELYSDLFYDEEETENTTTVTPSTQEQIESSINEGLVHELNSNAIKNKFKSFLQHFTTHVKASFDTLTRDDSCSVYITLVSIDNENKYFARTYYRDPVSYTERTHIDANKNQFNIELFTPFKFLFSGAEATLFACDDCKSYPNFIDICDNWHDYYNSCLTVPIRVRKSKVNNRHKVIGFITVDNKKGGLNNKDAKNLLCSYADLLYTPFNMFIDLVGTV